MSDSPSRPSTDDQCEGPRRFALTPLTEMTPEQRAVADAIMKGPRAAVGSPVAAVGATSLSSPFNVWNRCPELAHHLTSTPVRARDAPRPCHLLGAGPRSFTGQDIAGLLA